MYVVAFRGEKTLPGRPTDCRLRFLYDNRIDFRKVGMTWEVALTPAAYMEYQLRFG